MASVHQFGSDADHDHYDVLLSMADTIVLHLSLPELLADLSERLHQVFRFELANLSLHDPTRDVMRAHVWEGNESAIPIEVPIDESPGGWVWRNQLPMVIPDIAVETRFPRVLKGLSEKGLRSYCMLPLTTAQTRFGGLGLGSSVPDAYQNEQVRLLRRVAKLVALAIENSFIREILQKEKAALQTLVEINRTLTSSLDMQKLLPLIFSSLGKIVDREYVSLALHDHSMGSLRMYTLGDPQRPESAGLQMTQQSKDCVAYQVFEAGETKIFRRKDLSQVKAEGMIASGIQSLCCVPLRTASGSLGTLNVGSLREDAFDSVTVSILMQVAAQLAVALDNARAYREIEELKDKLAKEKLYLEDEIRTESHFEEIIGDSPVLNQVLSQAKTVAPTDATVLILGETGTGKELAARAIHRMSARKDGSFIKLNCAAIPTGLLESELFGHERGAFTGAINQKIGRLELADKGTLFLDEIGDIPLELQPKLLRVLQDQEFERLGSNRTIRVNVRLIAATNRDLRKRIAEHEFRSDLFYRLNVFPIVLPPLRERGEDLLQLVRFFVQKLSRGMNKKIETIPTETIKALQNWHWPGNVRELENIIERSVLLSDGRTLKVPLTELTSGDDSGPGEGTLREVERRHIIRVLKATRGVIAGVHGAASKLGLKRTTLQSRIQKLRISRQEYQV
jgi:formate hydrogenlyase transcriptional activator